MMGVHTMITSTSGGLVKTCAEHDIATLTCRILERANKRRLPSALTTDTMLTLIHTKD